MHVDDFSPCTVGPMTCQVSVYVLRSLFYAPKWVILHFTMLNLQPVLPITVHSLENGTAHELHLTGQLPKTYVSSYSGYRYGSFE